MQIRIPHPKQSTGLFYRMHGNKKITAPDASQIAKSSDS